PPFGHLAIFAQELFPAEAQNGFTGVMEIRSPSPLYPVTLKLTINGRGDEVYTTLPVADLTRPVTAAQLIFPQIAIDGGFATRLIFLNPSTGTAATGRLSLFQSSGAALTVPLGFPRV